MTVSAEPVPGDALARFVTEHARNDFPALPVREDVDVAVALWRPSRRWRTRRCGSRRRRVRCCPDRA